MSVELTTEGLKRWKEVAGLVFAYIAALRAPAALESVGTFAEECVALADLGWQFSEKGDVSGWVTLSSVES